MKGSYLLNLTDDTYKKLLICIQYKVIYDDRNYFWKILTLIQMKPSTLKSANETSILDIPVYKKVIKTLIKFLLFPTLKTEKFLLFPTLGSKFLLFRWFKFTLKPPYTVAHENLLSLIWDASHRNFFLKFGLKTAYDMS